MTSHRMMWTGGALGASALALGLFLFLLDDNDSTSPSAAKRGAEGSELLDSSPDRGRVSRPVLGVTVEPQRPAVDGAWEQRLASQPSVVLAFFEQETATKEQWAVAYEAASCACVDTECVTALQNDFLNRAPILVDRTITDAASAAMRRAAECGAAVFRGD